MTDAPLSSGPELVEIYDTTLRDGSQREGISYTASDKLRIAQKLDEFGVSFIEGGWPGSNPKDVEFFERAKDVEWKHAVITAFGSTRRAKLGPESDPNVRALLDAGTAACTVVGKTWTLHVTEVLRTTLEDNLKMIEESVRYLVSEKRRVIYDAEHFFDGYASDAGYALETLRAALRGGAETLVLCETNGGRLPWFVEETTRAVVAALGAETRIGIHAHDDSGCGVANSLAAVRGGAKHVQGTVNGYGERCGNANLSVIIPNLELKLGRRCLEPGRLRDITEVSRFVAEVANLAPDTHMAYVGKSAFAHKGGIHVAAMRRNTDSYQHVDPALVGNEMRVVVSELSGRGNVLSKAEELGVKVAAGLDVEALDEIKKAEARGVSYEGAEASVALLLARKAADYQPLFVVQDYETRVGRRGGGETYAEATVKLRVGTHLFHTAAEGNGPVSALDAALRKALTPVYPALASIHLADYKVRILDGKDGTEATTRVLIDSQYEQETYSTVGASPNIILASLEALVDAVEYGLRQHGARLADAELARSDRPSERPAARAP
ncbi:MAG TPA: citramalate synthase [Polyangiaceae bacterium]|nr:citramalate synthase [Polyangiaceae bacterium]